MSIETPRCGGLGLATISLAILVMATGPPVAFAGFPTPSPTHSTVPNCFSACPQGDGPVIQITVRDFSNQPLINSVVEINLCDCSSARFCPQHGSEGYIVVSPCIARAVTDISARVTFTLAAGGACTGGVRIYADGVLLATRALASTDQDGDLVVAAPDLTLHAPKIGTSDPSGDLDCNGAVNSTDATIISGHSGHTCFAVTGARGTRWGELKIRYR